MVVIPFTCKMGVVRMKLKPIALGLALGIVWGVTVMFATWWIIAAGGTGYTLGTLARFYIGFHRSFLGGIVGMIWGFIHAFIVGYILATIYNIFAKE
jgi:hypothetical protein